MNLDQASRDHSRRNSSELFHDDDDLLEKGSKSLDAPTLNRRPLGYILTIAGQVVVILGLLALLQYQQTAGVRGVDQSYRPASLENVIVYENKVFHGDLDVATPYKSPPGPETDAAWDKITDIGMVKLQKEDIDALNRNTYQLHDGSGYVGFVDMFHQLHCLNLIRRCLFPSAYPDCPDSSGSYHLLHCVDVLRQGIMCHGDTNIITWDFEPGRDKPVANGTVEHTCRSFDEIYEWTAARFISLKELQASVKEHNREMGFPV